MMRFRPAHTGDGRAGQQVQLRAGRVLLLVLRGAAVLPLRGAAERGRAARRRGVRRRGGARVHLLRALPGARARRPRRAAAARPPRHRPPTPPPRPLSDSLDDVHASSECARFEVIVLRSRAAHRHVPRSSDYDRNFY